MFSWLQLMPALRRLVVFPIRPLNKGSFYMLFREKDLMKSNEITWIITETVLLLALHETGGTRFLVERLLQQWKLAEAEWGTEFPTEVMLLNYWITKFPQSSLILNIVELKCVFFPWLSQIAIFWTFPWRDSKNETFSRELSIDSRLFFKF